MSLLSPLVLAAAAFAAVPLLLHLLQRDRGQRIVFPALRYLQRTEREHARRIRARQLLLLALRVLAVLLLALAGAQPVLTGSGGAHPPTAVVVVLDNSVGSGRVLGEDRVLDRLRSLALDGIANADAGDRIHVLRAGAPSEPLVPLSADGARARITATEPTAARADLGAALRRARRLAQDALADGAVTAAEIHLVSELRRSGFPTTGTPGTPTADPDVDPVPVLVASIDPTPAPNRFVASAVLGGGLPPLAGTRTRLEVVLGGDALEPVTVRAFIDGRVAGATRIAAGGAGTIELGPFPEGWRTGWVEADPDALRADDRRWFAANIAPAPVVAFPGPGHPFLEAALATLAEGGRLQAGSAALATTVIADAGAGLELRRPRTVVVPPTDPARLAALNRRLGDDGIPWRYEPPLAAQGAMQVSDAPADAALADTRVLRRYGLVPAEVGAAGEVLGRTSDGAPWAVAFTRDDASHVLLLSHPLEEGWSTLPVDAAMVPFVSWAVAGWTGGGANGPEVGEPLPLPQRADAVLLPDGTRLSVDGTSQLPATLQPGIHTVLSGDSVLALTAVNAATLPAPDPRLSPEALALRVGPGLEVVDDPDRWAASTFVRRQGRGLWLPLVIAALALLLVESRLAASGRATPRGSAPGTPPSTASASRRATNS